MKSAASIAGTKNWFWRTPSARPLPKARETESDGDERAKLPLHIGHLALPALVTDGRRDVEVPHEIGVRLIQLLPHRAVVLKPAAQGHAALDGRRPGAARAGARGRKGVGGTSVRGRQLHQRYRPVDAARPAREEEQEIATRADDGHRLHAVEAAALVV